MGADTTHNTKPIGHPPAGRAFSDAPPGRLMDNVAIDYCAEVERIDLNPLRTR